MGTRKKPHEDKQVVLVGLPSGFLDGLPVEDQRAITAMIGQPVTLVGYDEDGRAELEFADPFDGPNSSHTIWVAPEFMAPIQV
jgi:hypothetical protein